MTIGTLSSREARRKLYERVRTDALFKAKAEAVLEVGVQYLGVDNGHLTRIDRATDYWEATVSTDPPDGQFPPGLELDLGTTYCRLTIDSEGPVEFHDAAADGRNDDPAYEKHGIGCYHGSTVVLDGESFGTICFVAEEPRSEPFEDEETMFAELLARILERELERKHHESELSRQATLSSVLNRVLRHNLRNDLSVIRGYTQLMAEEGAVDSYCQTVLDNVAELASLSRKARELDRIVRTDTDRIRTNIKSLVEDIVDDVSSRHPDAVISTTITESITVPVYPSFERAVRELIDNAMKHAGPTVDVAVTRIPNGLEIEVSDDGPGLPEQEVAVLREGVETPLTHGSGLGLWLVYWIVTSHGGSIDVTVSEGTTMSITIPRTADANAEDQLSTLARARDRYKAAFREATDGMLLLNEEAQIVDANPTATELHGLPRERLLGQPIERFLRDAFDFEAAWKRLHDGGIDRETAIVVGEDGEERRVEYSATPNVVSNCHLVVSRPISALD